MSIHRREFLAAAGAAALSAATRSRARRVRRARDFTISLAGWSLHREVRSGRRRQIELFQLVRDEYDIRAFELVNLMLEVPTASYVDRLGSAAERAGVGIPLIMIDGEGALGHAAAEGRRRAVRYHRKWIEIAADLGCHAIRVNWDGYQADSLDDPAATEAFIDRSTGSFRRLCEMAAERSLRVLIENHGGGPSTRPALLSQLIDRVDRNLGTLPDFGNFPEGTDRYRAIDRMMPFAGAVSAKCRDFDAAGNETHTDFERMLAIVVDRHGYAGDIGIEYEGRNLPELEGIRRCQQLLMRLRNA